MLDKAERRGRMDSVGTRGLSVDGSSISLTIPMLIVLLLRSAIIPLGRWKGCGEWMVCGAVE